MSNTIFPVLAGLGWSVKKTPTFKTLVGQAVSGMEVRQALMQFPLWEFELTYEILRDNPAQQNPTAPYNELKTLGGFYLARQGMFDDFLFDDVTDDTVTSQSFGTGDGATTNFQLVRSWGGFSEPVMNPNVITGVYDNGTPVTQGSGAGKYTVNSTGLITFGTAPAATHVLSWTGTFYYRCRFASDTTEFEEFMSNMWLLKQLQFIGSPMNKV